MTYGSQRYRGGSQANQTTISGMRLVYGIGVVMAKLINDLPNILMLSLENGVPNNFLESGKNSLEVSLCLALRFVPSMGIT